MRSIKFKIVLSILILFLSVFSLPVNILAEEAANEKIQVNITTDKNSYTKGDKVVIDINVKNISGSEIKDIETLNCLSKELKIENSNGGQILDGNKIKWSLDKLENNQQISFKVNTSIVANEDNSTSIGSSNSNNYPQTATNYYNILLLGIFLLLTSFVLLLCVLKKNRKKNSTGVLLLALVFSSLTLSSYKVNAQEAGNSNISISKEYKIVYDGKEFSNKVEIKALAVEEKPEINLSWKNPNYNELFVKGEKVDYEIIAANKYTEEKLNEVKWKVEETNINGTGNNISFNMPDITGTYVIKASLTIDGKTKEISKEITCLEKSIADIVEEQKPVDKINKTLDPNGDIDGDGIITREENKLGTNPESIDTDEDGLSDYGEVYTYKTNPLVPDTDSDSILDGFEIKLGLNPNSAEKPQNQYTLTINNDEVNASLKVVGSPEAVSTSKIEKVEDDYLSNTAGIVGSIIDLSSKSAPDNAEISIKYSLDEVNKKGLSEDELTIFYIDETKLELVKVPSSVDKSNNTVSAKLNHFSKYVVGDGGKINTKLSRMDIVFVIDQSGSMSTNDEDNKRIDVCQGLINSLNGDYKYGAVKFSDSASTVNSLTINKNIICGALDKLRDTASGGTNIGDAIRSGLSLFNDANARKIMIFLTDGDDNYSRNISGAVKDAQSKNVQIYTVGLGNSVNVNLLKNTISLPTSGQYFHADNADMLEKMFKMIEVNVTAPKNEQITVNGKAVTLQEVAKNSFKSDVDGFKFKNFSSNVAGGTCFGLSAASLLYYYSLLPLEGDNRFNNNTNYNLRDTSDIFKNGKKLYDNNANVNVLDLKLEWKYNDPKIKLNGKDCYALKDTIKTHYVARGFEFYDVKGIDSKTNKTFYVEYPRINMARIQTAPGWQPWELEIIKAVTWWWDAQEGSKYDKPIGTIKNLKEKISSGPVAISFSNSSFSSFFNGYKGHTIIAQRLLRNINDSSIYYIEIYDNNFPGNYKYIEVKNNDLFDLSSDWDNLTFEDYDYDFEDSHCFYLTDIIKLRNDIIK